MSLVQRSSEFLKEVRLESTKVSWPTRRELRDATLVVIVATLLMATILYVLDRILVIALNLVFRAG